MLQLATLLLTTPQQILKDPLRASDRCTASDCYCDYHNLVTTWGVSAFDRASCPADPLRWRLPCCNAVRGVSWPSLLTRLGHAVPLKNDDKANEAKDSIREPIEVGA